MGYGGKAAERARARELRAESWTLDEIATELGVSKASVSVWVRDVEFTPTPRNRGHRSHQPHPLHLAKLAEIERCRVDAEALIGELSDRDIMMYALALYAGEGSKRGTSVVFSNSDPVLMRAFVRWFRHPFEPEESKFRVKLYLHADLELDAAIDYWSGVLSVPPSQFNKPYRAVPDTTLRTNRHVFGCASVVYHSALLHRRVMAMIAAIGSAFADPG